MIRTQIYLDDQLISNLRTGAVLNKTTVSGYIRDLLREKIIRNFPVKKSKSNPLLELVRFADKGPKPKKLVNISGNMDKYLPKEWR